MSPLVKSLAARIGEHQRRFFAAGGKPKAIKYPKEWRAEAVRLRRDLKMPIADLANELGIGHSALKRWCDGDNKGPKSDPRPTLVKAGFVPVEIVPGDGRGATRTVRTAAAQVTLREITIAVAPDADDDAVAAVVAILVKSGRSAPC